MASLLSFVFRESVKPKEYFVRMNLHDLIYYIQPKWNTYNMGLGADKMSEPEMENLTTSLTVYKEKGGDIGYFRAGAGAPNNCVVC